MLNIHMRKSPAAKKAPRAHYIRFLDEFEPKALLFENVLGMFMVCETWFSFNFFRDPLG